MHKEALGGFNQALATRGRAGGPGGGLTEKERHLAKVARRTMV